MNYKKVDISDYDYNLPEERIAQYPVKERDTSRLLIYNNGRISEDVFRNVTSYIPEGSLLVFNNTRVIRARLHFKKESGAEIEILCLEPLNPADYTLSLGSAKPVEWKCIVGNLKKWKKDELRMHFSHNGKDYILKASRATDPGETQKIIFSWTPDDLCFGQVIYAAGHLPLPPYISREDTPEDNIRYQTIYSREDGSVAAPTAGLHFSDSVINGLKEKGIPTAEVTLHVGAGTFKPVKNNDITKHEMHCEHFYVSVETLRTLLEYEEKIIAVGTTSVRTLESLFWIGAKLAMNKNNPHVEYIVKQWEPYNTDISISFREAIEALLEHLGKLNKRGLEASTSIMIVPGYRFRMTNCIITNFHQPRSTLLLLISAWTGDNWKSIYDFALKNDFRFLSYGDSSILFSNA